MRRRLRTAPARSRGGPLTEQFPTSPARRRTEADVPVWLYIRRRRRRRALLIWGAVVVALAAALTALWAIRAHADRRAGGHALTGQVAERGAGGPPSPGALAFSPDGPTAAGVAFSPGGPTAARVGGAALPGAPAPSASVPAKATATASSTALPSPSGELGAALSRRLSGAPLVGQSRLLAPSWASATPATTSIWELRASVRTARGRAGRERSPRRYAGTWRQRRSLGGDRAASDRRGIW